MKLSVAATVPYSGSDKFETIAILEDEASPRWSFKYDNFEHDPTPDILVLGMYRHPNTGNNLVGAINLRYLDKNQIYQLQKIIPRLNKVNSLKRRYYIGLTLLPEVFENYYRTYNASHIRDLKRGTIYPKYGVLKTAGRYLKKKATDIFKTQQQKEKEAMPSFPADIQDIDSRIDQAVRGVAQADPIDVPEQDIDAAQDDVRRQQQEPQRNVAQQKQSGERAVDAAKAAKTQQRMVRQGVMPDPRERQKQAYRSDQDQIEQDVADAPIPQPGNLPQDKQQVDKLEVDQTDTEQVVDAKRTQPSAEEDIEPTVEEIRYWSPTLNRFITEIIQI